MKKNAAKPATSFPSTPSAPRGLRIKSGIKAGPCGLDTNHNETALRAPSGLRIKSGIKAGPEGIAANHNETLLSAC